MGKVEDGAAAMGVVQSSPQLSAAFSAAGRRIAMGILKTEKLTQVSYHPLIVQEHMQA